MVKSNNFSLEKTLLIIVYVVMMYHQFLQNHTLPNSE